MADPFTTVILRLKGTGFFEFMLPFLLSSAIFYGLLRKSQIFGDPDKNIAVNAVVALTAGFMVWAYPILAGVSFMDKLPAFFAQAMSAMLVIIVGLLATSMFLPPDLPSKLEAKLGGRAFSIILLAGILIGGGILVSSGLINIFFPAGGFEAIGLSEDVVLTIAIVILFFVTILVMVWGGGKK
ncbi:MAG: hypothetical protein NZ942_01385 [Candidatus Aenigmarchaeota archaeon]|nr:hypothetical protein [Candidatus Aenigmarchaeota archaeon]